MRWMDSDLSSTWFVQNDNSVLPLFQVCSLQYWEYMNVVWIYAYLDFLGRNLVPSDF